MIREEILSCFSNLGIIIDDAETNFTLAEYLVDSVAFISFLVELEQKFDIEISDEYLIQGRIENFEDIVNIVEDLISVKK